jgi:hypothetical protein
LSASNANKGNSINSIDKGDPMLVRKPDGGNNDVKNFPLPKPAGDGSCDINSGSSFMTDLSGETCILKVSDFQKAC